MPKKKSTKEKEEIKKEEIPLADKAVDYTEQIKQVMAFGVSSAYDLGIEGGATIAKQYNPVTKLGNVEKLPERKK
jgi:hypothetical protein